MDETMYDFEKRQTERAEENARKKEVDLKTADKLNENARELAQAIFEYSSKHGTLHRPPPLPNTNMNTVRLRVVGDPSDASLEITLRSDKTYDVFEVGAPAGGHLDSKLDKKAMMDRVLDWLAG